MEGMVGNLQILDTPFTFLDSPPTSPTVLVAVGGCIPVIPVPGTLPQLEALLTLRGGTVGPTPLALQCLAEFPWNVCLCLLIQRILTTSQILPVRVNWVRIRVGSGMGLRWPFFSLLESDIEVCSPSFVCDEPGATPSLPVPLLGLMLKLQDTEAATLFLW